MAVAFVTGAGFGVSTTAAFVTAGFDASGNLGLGPSAEVVFAAAAALCSSKNVGFEAPGGFVASGGAAFVTGAGFGASGVAGFARARGASGIVTFPKFAGFGTSGTVAFRTLAGFVASRAVGFAGAAGSGAFRSAPGVRRIPRSVGTRVARGSFTSGATDVDTRVGAGLPGRGLGGTALRTGTDEMPRDDGASAVSVLSPTPGVVATRSRDWVGLFRTSGMGRSLCEGGEAKRPATWSDARAMLTPAAARTCSSGAAKTMTVLPKCATNSRVTCGSAASAATTSTSPSAPERIGKASNRSHMPGGSCVIR
jgi:hypothetical protein